MNRISWNDYFLAIAAAVSNRSTCLRRHYGAVIVNSDHKIVSTGYNGACRGQQNCTDIGSCIRETMHINHGERYELCNAVHAEMNAVINGNPTDLYGSTLYLYGEDINHTIVNAAPCLLCQRVIANARIKEVVYITPDKPISYLVDPNDINYYDLRIDFNCKRYIPDKHVCIAAKSDDEAYEKVSKELKDNMEAVAAFITREINLHQLSEEERRSVSDTIQVKIPSIVRISRDIYDTKESWIIPHNRP